MSINLITARKAINENTAPLTEVKVIGKGRMPIGVIEDKINADETTSSGIKYSEFLADWLYDSGTIRLTTGSQFGLMLLVQMGVKPYLMVADYKIELTTEQIAQLQSMLTDAENTPAGKRGRKSGGELDAVDTF